MLHVVIFFHCFYLCYFFPLFAHFSDKNAVGYFVVNGEIYEYIFLLYDTSDAKSERFMIIILPSKVLKIIIIYNSIANCFYIRLKDPLISS